MVMGSKCAGAGCSVTMLCGASDRYELRACVASRAGPLETFNTHVKSTKSTSKNIFFRV